MTKRILIGLLILVITGSIIAFGFFNAKEPPKRIQVPPAPVVETIFAKEDTIQFRVSSQGPVRPKLESNIVAEVSGRISDVSKNFRVGAFIKKGETLFKIDQANYIANLRSAEASLAQAKASYQDANAKTEQARKDWKKIGTGQANDLVLKIPQLNQAKASVQSAEANLLKAQRDLSRTKVKAPFDALIKNKSVDLGQYVNTGSNVATLYGTATAEVRLPLPDRDLAFLNLPKQSDAKTFSNVQLAGIYAGQEQQWYGKVIRTEGVVEESNRLTYLVAEINDPYGLNSNQDREIPLRFGTFVNAQIEGISRGNLISLPRSALINKNQILVIAEESKIQIATVNIVRGEKDYIYIDTGVATGQEVVITPVENPINGMLVKKLSDKQKDDLEKSEKLATEEKPEGKAGSSVKNVSVGQ